MFYSVGLTLAVKSISRAIFKSPLRQYLNPHCHVPLLFVMHELKIDVKYDFTLTYFNYFPKKGKGPYQVRKIKFRVDTASLLS